VRSDCNVGLHHKKDGVYTNISEGPAPGHDDNAVLKSCQLVFLSLTSVIKVAHIKVHMARLLGSDT